MTIDPTIFKAYDIRGIYPDQLNEEQAYAISRAYATLMLREASGQELTIAVGSDARLSSPSLKAKVIAGLVDSGINVVDIGLVSTPVFYFAVAFNNFDGGLQVSASHNPKQYNGFKMVRRGAVALSGDTGIQELRQITEKESFVASEKKGTVTQKVGVTEQAIAEYLKITGTLPTKKFKIVIDPGNGMGGPDFDALFEKLPSEIIKMNFEPDGTFPAHEADPIKEQNTQAVRDRVVVEHADLGIATDGDNDRIFIIDELGHTIPSNILYTIMAQVELAQHPTATYAYELRLGRLIEDEFENTQARLVQTPVGHALIKNIMIKEKAIFGGEISGHYFYKMPFGTFEAPPLLVIKLLQFLSEQDKPLSEIVAPYRRYISSGEINTPMPSREKILEKIEQIKSKYSDGQQTFIDGVKIDYPDYWVSVRPSNTEPLIRLMVEAKDEATMARVRDEILQLIRSN